MTSIEVKMPAQRAILHDILVNGLDPTKKHSDLSKNGNLKQQIEQELKKQTNESLFASKQKLVTSQKDDSATVESTEPAISPVVVLKDEVKDESAPQVSEQLEQTVEPVIEENLEEKPKKKLFQKKKSKDDVVL